MSISTEPSQQQEHIELPSWFFDVDEEDEQPDFRRSLLQELEIDPKHIYKNIMWMFLGPCYRLAGKPYKRHPLHSSSSANNRHSIDFWGPCAIVSLYSLILWLGRVREVPWIYIIWSIAATVNHLVSRVWYHSSLMIHIALLGYSTAPLIPFAALILLINPPMWLAVSLEVMSVVWATLSAITSYATIIAVPAEQKPRLRLLYPTVVLMALYVTSLMPIKRS